MVKAAADDLRRLNLLGYNRRVPTSGPPPTERIGGRISLESYNGWHQFADDHDVDVTSLLEAIGCLMGEDTGDAELPPYVERILEGARSVRRQRRRRRLD